MKKLAYSLLPLGITVGLCLNIAPASASLVVQNVIPDAALSIDGFGSTSNNGVIQANIPTGSTIQRAYLYAASVWNNPVYDARLSWGEVQYRVAENMTANGEDQGAVWVKASRVVDLVTAWR